MKTNTSEPNICEKGRHGDDMDIGNFVCNQKAPFGALNMGGASICAIFFRINIEFTVHVASK